MSKMDLYCLEIVRAFPDYKRPYASVDVYHFLTIKEANEKRREEKRQYYLNFIESLEEGEIKDIDNVNEEKAEEYIYSDSYMQMEPFSATLYLVHIETGTITSEIIPFPISNDIEGV